MRLKDRVQSLSIYKQKPPPFFLPKPLGYFKTTKRRTHERNPISEWQGSVVPLKPVFGDKD